MNVDILDGTVLIGQSVLDRLDPPMGVAIGNFVSTPHYDAHRHADVIDGEYVAERGTALVVRSQEYGVIERAAVSIWDYADGLGEREIHVLGIPYPQYETCFSANPGYREYWGLD